MSHSSGHAATTAAQAAEHAREALFAQWQIKDENTARYFGVAIAGLVAVFTIAHQANVLFTKDFATSSGAGRAARFIGRPFRKLIRSRVVAGVAVLPRKILLVLLYFGINAGLTFYDRPDRIGYNILAKRFGWLALCNLCLVMFLGLKNTPLSPLAGKSFDQVNVLHRCCGYTTIALSIIHSIMYVHGLSTYGVLEQIMTKSAQYAGAVAGLSMLLLAVTAVGFVRRRQYEIFFAVHIVLVATILVAVGLHRPNVGLKALVITIVAAGMWFADKSLRLSRWVYYGVGNYCVLTPLPGRATRISMHRSIRSQPGSMAFVWIPGVRVFQRHPFTLVSNESAEFVVQAREGFTNELYHAACRNPGVKFRAALEGPYGVVPNTHDFDKIVLVAGGSGVTFTLALALDWARRRRGPKDKSSLDFIWTVKNKASFEWFENELAELHARSRINVFLHVSGESAAYGSDSSTSLDARSSDDEDKIDDEKVDVEKIANAQTTARGRMKKPASTASSVTIRYDVGRPDLASTIKSALLGLTAEDRVLVAGCGPEALLRHTREAADDCRDTAAPSIRTYLEHYSF